MKKILNITNNSKKILSQDGIDYILEEGFNSDIELNAKSKLIIKSNNYSGLITIRNGTVVYENTKKNKNIFLPVTALSLIVVYYLVFFIIKQKYGAEYSYTYTLCISFLYIIWTMYLLIARKLTASSHLVGSVLFLCATLYGTMEFFDKIDNYDNQIQNQQKIQEINNEFEYISDMYRKKIINKEEVTNSIVNCPSLSQHTPEKITSFNFSKPTNIEEIKILKNLRVARDSCTNSVINELSLKYSFFNIIKNILLAIGVAFFVSILSAKVNVD